eukprot:TRINITY_DN2884_c1_g1_i1.p1 TRINITY_DN2884_c1_g1~~TRINITY_DN2884_c1_g1_i1.p1  ORF type:complete len:614 (+),score=124.07 TRINITY_DN2884_c1_g1_i1:115-1842(+)
MVKSLDMSRNEISRVTGLSPFSGLSTLNLSHNKLVSLKGLPLGLVKLNVSGNLLTSIDGVAKLPFIQEIDFSNNRITDAKGLPKSAPLTTLNLSNNRMPNTNGLEGLIQLQTLKLDNNYICLTEDMRNLSSCRGLKQLTLSGNPCADHASYRVSVSHLIPSLDMIDGSKVGKRQVPGWQVPSAKTPPKQGRRRSLSGGRTPQRYGRVIPTESETMSISGQHSILTSHSQALPSRAERERQRGDHTPRSHSYLDYQNATTPQNTYTSTPNRPSHRDPADHELSFTSVNNRLESSKIASMNVSRATENTINDYKRLLEDEQRLTASLSKQKKKLEHSLSDSRRVMARELAKLSECREEKLALEKQVEMWKAKADKRQREYKYAHEKNVRLDESYSKQLETLRVQYDAEISDFRARKQEGDSSWMEERQQLLNYVRVLESENATIRSAAASAGIDLSQHSVAMNHGHQQQQQQEHQRSPVVANSGNVAGPDDSLNWSEPPQSHQSASQQIEFAVGLKKWLLSELERSGQRPLSDSTLDLQEPSQQPPSVPLQSHIRSPRNVEAMWSHNSMQAQQHELP